MLKKLQLRISVLIGIFFFQSCFGEEASQIIIPGYSSNVPAISSTSRPSMSLKKSTEKLASPGDLDDIVKSVNLGGWSTFSTYLWTCTPNNFNLVAANAKNKLRMELDELVQETQIPTLSAAKNLADKAQQLIGYRIIGLYGSLCQITINYPKTKKASLQTFDCLFNVRSARYLSQLAAVIAETNGKTDLVPDQTLEAFTNFVVEYCRKL